MVGYAHSKVYGYMSRDLTKTIAKLVNKLKNREVISCEIFHKKMSCD